MDCITKKSGSSTRKLKAKAQFKFKLNFQELAWRDATAA
jgi:hypothetical protein